MLHDHILDSDYARYTQRGKGMMRAQLCASVDTRMSAAGARNKMRREFGPPRPAGTETDKNTHQSARRSTGVTKAASRTPTSRVWILVRTNRRLSEDREEGGVLVTVTLRASVDQVTSCYLLLH